MADVQSTRPAGAPSMAIPVVAGWGSIGDDAPVHTLRSALSAAAIALVTAWSSGALADLAPPDTCSGGAGTACNNAGSNADQAGICVATTCSSSHPNGDGGFTTSTYSCVLCEVPDGGSASSSSSSGGTATGGCTVGVVRGEGGLAGAGAALLVGLGLLGSRRRRRID